MILNMEVDDDFDWFSMDSDDEYEEEVDKKILVCKKQIVAFIDFGIAYFGYVYFFRNDWIKVYIYVWYGGEYMI